MAERRRAALDADIRKVNLVPVRFLLATQLGWSLQRIRKAEHEYRLYWQMIRDQPAAARVPSVDADQVWHCHLQCTALYVQACQQVFGRLLCHYPFAGNPHHPPARRQRRRLKKSSAMVAEKRGTCRSARVVHQQ